MVPLVGTVAFTAGKALWNSMGTSASKKSA